MKIGRRRFVQGAGVAGLGLLAGCGRLPGQASTPTKIYRLGYLAIDPTWPEHEAFRQGLRELGYAEGQNLAVAYRWAESDESSVGLAALATDLIGLPVDVLVVGAGTDAGRAAQQATSDVPIILAYSPDPVATGFVASLARPGGNITGLSTMAAQLNGKRLELFQAIVPQVSRLALVRAGGPAGLETEQAAQAAAQVMGIELLSLVAHELSEVGDALDEAVRWHADALMADGSPLVVGLRATVVDFAARHRLPLLGRSRAFTEIGGLMSYGPDRIAMFRRAAYYVDRILTGAKPGDLPVEQPMTFNFVINLKTAQALGLTIPPHVLLQATEVIQ